MWKLSGIVICTAKQRRCLKGALAVGSEKDAAADLGVPVAGGLPRAAQRHALQDAHLVEK